MVLPLEDPPWPPFPSPLVPERRTGPSTPAPPPQRRGKVPGNSGAARIARSAHGPEGGIPRLEVRSVPKVENAGRSQSHVVLRALLTLPEGMRVLPRSPSTPGSSFRRTLLHGINTCIQRTPRVSMSTSSKLGERTAGGSTATDGSKMAPHFRFIVSGTDRAGMRT